MIERLKLECLIAHSRNVLDVKLDRVLLSMKNVSDVIRILNDLSGVFVGCNYLIGENRSVRIGNFEAVCFPFCRKLDRHLDCFASLERSRVKYNDRRIVTAEAVKLNIAGNVHKCTLINAV